MLSEQDQKPTTYKVVHTYHINLNNCIGRLLGQNKNYSNFPILKASCFQKRHVWEKLKAKVHVCGTY